MTRSTRAPRFTWNRHEVAVQLGRILREAREKLGVSQHELSRRTGLSQAAISYYERGASVPSIHVLARLATELMIKLRLDFEEGRVTLVRVVSAQERIERAGV